MGCWTGTDSFFALIRETSPSLVAAQDPSRPGTATPVVLTQTSAEEGPPALLGPAGKWVAIGVNAARGARQYDEITAPGERKMLMRIQKDPSAEWTSEAWQEGAGLLRLGLNVSATGQVQTRVLLYRPGIGRPKTVYKGPKRLTKEGQ